MRIGPYTDGDSEPMLEDETQPARYASRVRCGRSGTEATSAARALIEALPLVATDMLELEHLIP